MGEEHPRPLRRRDLIALIGAAAGADTAYQAMTALGFAAESDYSGPIRLEGDVKGASVLILGAGLAGLVAAYELNRAGYRVQVLETENRLGGRCWSLRGGDTVSEVGGARQRCAFDAGLYFNPGPWRIPYHHRGLLDYCKRFKVALEPFVHVNYNAWVHSTKALGGRPQRMRHVAADFTGHVAELLAKAANTAALSEPVTREDREKLLEALRLWGALDRNDRYVKGAESSDHRGFAGEPGGGLSGAPEFSEPIGLSDLLNMGLWSNFGSRGEYDYQSPLFQPAGGMDMIARAFAGEVGAGPASIGIWLSTVSGIVQMHQSALTVCTCPGREASSNIAVTRLPSCRIAVTFLRFWRILRRAGETAAGQRYRGGRNVELAVSHPFRHGQLRNR